MHPTSYIRWVWGDPMWASITNIQLASIRTNMKF